MTSSLSNGPRGPRGLPGDRLGPTNSASPIAAGSAHCSLLLCFSYQAFPELGCARAHCPCFRAGSRSSDLRPTRKAGQSARLARAFPCRSPTSAT
ncbi:hypothetical protein NDU88_005808 [Pleurodeles waltl]|uniref:Uncharacterized protein n=1 Tax=Pleurodeles waltl TaxID=8319 RepID=A0AAV7NQ43_PLEWA|nr:hypothetical protein NDU88_005808 [Pleurodeles waltl]